MLDENWDILTNASKDYKIELLRHSKTGYYEFNCGNVELLGMKKVAFFSSMQYGADNVSACHNWVERTIGKDYCVVSCYQSALEKDVCNKFMLVGHPLIIVGTTGVVQHLEDIPKERYDESNLLRITRLSFDSSLQVRDICLERNRAIISICDMVAIGSCSRGGMTESLLKGIKIPYRILR